MSYKAKKMKTPAVTRLEANAIIIMVCPYGLTKSAKEYKRRIKELRKRATELDLNIWIDTPVDFPSN